MGSKEKILDAAVGLASRYGLEGVTIGNLAKTVGMSKSGLMFHFGNKDGLKKMIVESAVDHFTENVLRKSFKHPRGEPRLKALLENWIKFIEDVTKSPSARLLISATVEVNEQPGDLQDYVKKVQTDLLATIERSVTMAIEQGHFLPETQPKLFAWRVYCLVLGFHHFHRLMEDQSSREYLNLAFNELIQSAKAHAEPNTERRTQHG